MISAIILPIQNESDKEFIEKIYINYKKPMTNYIFSITDDHLSVEDIIHEVFINLISNISTVITMESSNLNSYIICATRNTVINCQKRKHLNFFYQWNVNDIFSYFVDSNQDIEPICIKNETEARLHHLIKSLSIKDQELIIGKYFTELSDEEISDLMGIKKQNVRVYIKRARDRALKLLEKEIGWK